MVNTGRGVEDIPTDRKPDIDDRGGWGMPVVRRAIRRGGHVIAHEP